MSLDESLGECEKCHGPLCLSGRVVTCESCGHQHPDHPHTAGWKNLPKEVPVVRDIPPQDYPATVPDRVLGMEKSGKELLSRLAAMERRLAALEAAMADTAPLRKRG